VSTEGVSLLRPSAKSALSEQMSQGSSNTTLEPISSDIDSQAKSTRAIPGESREIKRLSSFNSAGITETMISRFGERELSRG